MNKRCIVNVATGEFYRKMQDRLILSLCGQIHRNIFNYEDGKQLEWSQLYKKSDIDLMVWKDILPTGSRPHSESPYGFKVHAIKAAQKMGYTSILWLDSPAYAVKEDISPIFDKIEKEGYYAMSHIDPLENYIHQNIFDTYKILRHTDISDKNLPSGSCYGFDLSNKKGSFLFYCLVDAEKMGAFNLPAPHRHDETVLAAVLAINDWPVFTFDPLFQSDSPECVIKSGG